MAGRADLGPGFGLTAGGAAGVALAALLVSSMASAQGVAPATTAGPAADAPAPGTATPTDLPVDDAKAQALLYPYDQAELRFVPDLGVTGPALKQIRDAAADLPFYGAVAARKVGRHRIGYAMAAGFHSPEAAGAAARARCNAKAQASDCVVIAHVLPPGWVKGRVLQLSARATLMYQERYMPEGGPAAMAIAPGGTGAALALGQDAAPRALAACRKGARAASDTEFDCHDTEAGATCAFGPGAQACRLVLRD
ncbi:hypothetical protein [Acidimangrovimonas sediminis]|uniref:hypothetical protein n=1 Tax=Acidimangrovimonas sediminis TaxID=2056283 RepID=UPI000C80DC3D|nr:hypothetical protein [Acidimangrovimonas sediminis]